MSKLALTCQNWFNFPNFFKPVKICSNLFLFLFPQFLYYLRSLLRLVLPVLFPLMISTDENLSNRWDIFIHWWNFHFSWFFGWISKNKQNSQKLYVAKLSFGSMIDRILTKKHGKLTFHPWMKRFFSCKKSSSIKPLRKFYKQKVFAPQITGSLNRTDLFIDYIGFYFPISTIK